jgi:hypothetical protein
MHKQLLASILLFISLAQFAWADPISRIDANAWIARVNDYRSNGDPKFDLRAFYDKNREDAATRLNTNPADREAMRDLADAFHGLGHFAEFDHNYRQALLYHEQSLNLYKRTRGLKSRESWGDGEDHAQEHIFMDLYDWAIMYERANEMGQAQIYFDRAYEQAKLSLTLKVRSEIRDNTNTRFVSRYLPLMRRRQILKQPLTPLEVNAADYACTWALINDGKTDD